MTFLDHIKSRTDLYVLLVSWALVGFVAPTIVAVGYSALTFLLVLRTRDITKIFIAFIAMLVFSDSRSSMFAFAETAKIGAVVLLFLYVVLNWGKFSQNSNKVFVYFLPFLLYAVAASAWANDPFNAFQKSFSYGLIFFLVPVVFAQGLKDNRNIPVELVYFFSVLLAVGLIIHLVNPSFTSLVGRYRGLLGNPNGLGIFLTVVFAVYYPVRKEYELLSSNQRFTWFFLIVFIASLVLTGSRTSLIALALFFGFNRLRYLSNAITVIVFIVLVLSYEYLLLQLPIIIQSLGLAEYFRLDTLEEGSGRFIAWNFAWQRIQEVFFVGGGFTHTEYVFRLFSDELSRLGHQGNAHNSYLTLWLDTGLIGIVLFGLGLVRTVAAAIKSSPYTLPIVYAVLFSTYFESWLSASLNPFTSLFLIALTLLAIPADALDKNKIRQNESNPVEE
ncbi:MAG: O-antigen ligase family protein [Salibacteraceae bacterium]